MCIYVLTAEIWWCNTYFHIFFSNIRSDAFFEGGGEAILPFHQLLLCKIFDELQSAVIKSVITVIWVTPGILYCTHFLYCPVQRSWTGQYTLVVLSRPTELNWLFRVVSTFALYSSFACTYTCTSTPKVTNPGKYYIFLLYKYVLYNI